MQRLITAAVQALQDGSELSGSSVIATIKHFPGAGAAAVMPYGYSTVPMLGGDAVENSADQSAVVMTDLLRDEMGFTGIIQTDWGLNFVGATRAGADILGGMGVRSSSELVDEVDEERLTDACRRILEAKFRLGIFENPYVDEDAVYDVVGTDFDDTFTDSTLQVEVMVKNHTSSAQSARVALHLYDAEGIELPLTDSLLEAHIPAGEETTLAFCVPVAAPRKWSAEEPYLYTLVLEEQTASGTVYESAQVGFRKITYKTTASGWFEGNTDDADLIRINGQPISFRGVDRHETHPEYGYALPKSVMEEDIRILLENNINAVRTSHYPNSPYWYYLCDKYGIYVMDEANLECHSNMIYENERITDYMTASILDREYSMVRRDRNHASVVMWSLGNECKNPEILRTILVQSYPDPEGTGRVLHAETADRPWHYEQARLMTETGIDVYSGMYYRVEVLREYGESNAALPMIECEYEHAMGNSEGNFDEYWDAFDTYRNLQGGFIWDFIDQSIYQTADDGTVFFGYGGDFGERVHDDNFCANGLLLPDRTVQPEMAEVRCHYQQLKFRDVDASNGVVGLRNAAHPAGAGGRAGAAPRHRDGAGSGRPPL